MFLVLIIAILNLGLGFALAVYLGRYERAAESDFVPDSSFSATESDDPPFQGGSETFVSVEKVDSLSGGEFTDDTTKTAADSSVLLSQDPADSSFEGEVLSY